jgi:hypothetical protein
MYQKNVFSENEPKFNQAGVEISKNQSQKRTQVGGSLGVGWGVLDPFPGGWMGSFGSGLGFDTAACALAGVATRTAF